MMQPYIQCSNVDYQLSFTQLSGISMEELKGAVSQHYLQDRVTMPHWYFTSDIAYELHDSVTSASW